MYNKDIDCYLTLLDTRCPTSGVGQVPRNRPEYLFRDRVPKWGVLSGCEEEKITEGKRKGRREMKHTFTAHSGGDEVGRSCYEHDDVIVVDYGGLQKEGEGRRPKCAPMPLGNKKVFVVGHCHWDHCFGAPAFAREHPESMILMTQPTRDGMEIQLRNSLKLEEEYRKEEALEGRNPPPPFFTEDDINNLLKRADSMLVRDERWFEPIPGYKMSFRSGGHISGDAMILIEYPDGTPVMHACDYCLQDQWFVRGAKAPNDFHPKVLVTECTNGAIELPDQKEERARFREAALRVIGRGGKIVVPVFSATGLDKAVELESAGVLTFLDGMARDFSRLLRLLEPWSKNDIAFRPENHPGLWLVDGEKFGERDSAYRRTMMESEAAFAVAAPSGMATGGTVIGHFEALLEDPKNAVMLTGYQAPETGGKKIAQLGKGGEISFPHKRIRRRADGSFMESWIETRKINCEVYTFRISGHSGGDLCARWIAKEICPELVLTVHGDPDAHAGLADRIRHLNSRIRCKSVRNGETIEF